MTLMTRILALGLLSLSLSLPAYAQDQSQNLRLTVQELREIMLTKASYSCGTRKYCSRNIASCQEAVWYLRNCNWGYKLDSDNDGVPCENLCGG